MSGHWAPVLSSYCEHKSRTSTGRNRHRKWPLTPNQHHVNARILLSLNHHCRGHPSLHTYGMCGWLVGEQRMRPWMAAMVTLLDPGDCQTQNPCREPPGSAHHVPVGAGAGTVSTSDVWVVARLLRQSCCRSTRVWACRHQSPCCCPLGECWHLQWSVRSRAEATPATRDGATTLQGFPPAVLTHGMLLGWLQITCQLTLTSRTGGWDVMTREEGERERETEG